MTRRRPVTAVIGTVSLPAANVGAAYSQTLAASGGTAPLTWAVTSGSLPAGLTLNASTGTISGFPSTAGNSTFTVTVTDSSLTPKTASADLSLTVAYNGPSKPLNAKATGQDGQVVLTWDTPTILTNFSWYDVYRATTPGVPTSGTPVGTFVFDNTWTDTSVTDGTKYYYVVVADGGSAGLSPASNEVSATPAALAVGTASLRGAAVGSAYSQTLTATGGTAPYTWAVSAGSLPRGLSLGVSTGRITGRPTAVP